MGAGCQMWSDPGSVRKILFRTADHDFLPADPKNREIYHLTLEDLPQVVVCNIGPKMYFSWWHMESSGENEWEARTDFARIMHLVINKAGRHGYMAFRQTLDVRRELVGVVGLPNISLQHMQSFFFLTLPTIRLQQIWVFLLVWVIYHQLATDSRDFLLVLFYLLELAENYIIHVSGGFWCWRRNNNFLRYRQVDDIGFRYLDFKHLGFAILVSRFCFIWGELILCFFVRTWYLVIWLFFCSYFVFGNLIVRLVLELGVLFVWIDPFEWVFHILERFVSIDRLAYISKLNCIEQGGCRVYS